MLDLLTSHGVATRYPIEAERRRRLGKFYHRPPGGESWVDVALRIRSLRDSLAREHLNKRVLLVTHDVDEAIALADRVAVLENGRIGADIPVDLPAPRTPGTPDYAALRTRLLALLGVTGTGEPEQDPKLNAATAEKTQENGHHRS